MKALPWLGGVVLVAVIGAGTAAALRAQNDGAHALTASKPPITSLYEGSFTADRHPYRHQVRSTDPSTTTGTTKASAPPAQAAPAPVPAAPSIVIGSTQQTLINRDRASAGLGPLTWSSCLYNVAASNARRMAAQGYISHTNGPSVDLGCGLGHQAGENVGYWSAGINDSQLNSMFWASAEHRANILGPYHYVATAWVVAPNGYAYIAVELS